MPSLNSFNARTTISAGGKTFTYFDLKAASANGLGDISRLPISLKVLLENLLRTEDGVAVKKAVTGKKCKTFVKGHYNSDGSHTKGHFRKVCKSSCKK